MPPLSAWQQTRVFPLPERRSGCCRAQPHPSSSPARDFTAEAAQQPVTRLPKEELKLQGPGRPAPPAHHTGPDALRGQSCLLQAVQPQGSLAMPALPPGVHVYTDHEAARHGLPADLGLGTAPPGSPPLTPAPSEAVAADGAEDQHCPGRSYTRKPRPSGDPVSRPLACFTVFQTRTLGWDWGFFPCLLHRQEAGRRGTGDGKRSCPLGGGCDMEVWAWTQGTGQGCP